MSEEEKNVAQTEQDMREHEREARERIDEEQSPEDESIGGVGADDDPGLPGNVQPGGSSG